MSNPGMKRLAYRFAERYFPNELANGRAAIACLRGHSVLHRWHIEHLGGGVEVRGGPALISHVHIKQSWTARIYDREKGKHDE